MKRTQTIVTTYEWVSPTGEPVRPEHVNALERRAREVIASEKQHAKLKGELTHWVSEPNGNSKDGIAYRGWWSVTLQSEENTE